jgi:hypothetical protein
MGVQRPNPQTGADPVKKGHQIANSRMAFGEAGRKLAGMIPWVADHVAMVFKRPKA